MRVRQNVIIVLLLGIALGFVVVGQLMQAAAADARPVTAPVTPVSAAVSGDNEIAGVRAVPFVNCRIGASIWSPYQESVEFDAFNLGVYINFSANSLPDSKGLEFWPMVRGKQDRDASGAYLDSYTISPAWSSLEILVQARPGALWIVGNEPDRDDIQDDTYPDMYARIYHDVYTFIKAIDPTARVGVAGLVGFTPAREQYLDIVWDTYYNLYGTTLDADVWTIHPYVLWESGGAGAHIALGTDPALAIPYSSDCDDPSSICWAEHDDMDLFTEQIVRMRRWMRQHGQQNKPLLVTEWGVLLPPDFKDEYGQDFSAARVSAYMRATQDYFRNAVDLTMGYPVDDYRLVQQWLWFPLGIDEYQASGAILVEPEAPYYSTDVGKAWQQYVEFIPPTANVRVQAHDAFVPEPATGVTLTATLYNIGNISTGEPVTVAFYSSGTALVPFHIETFDALPGCLWGHTVTATWYNNWSPGVYPYWVRVQTSSETIVAGMESIGRVWIQPEQVFLPLMIKGR